jgi:uncharacterized SAM-binding protein YcdF (DUF218 family)
MNNLLNLFNMASWKPILSALILPPVPFLLMIVIGARLILPKRGWGWSVILLSVLGLWFSACNGSAQLFNQWVLKAPAALSTQAINDIKSNTKQKQRTAIVILGGGVEPTAPEYGVANLQHASLERLRYGVWLSRQTGVPAAFSGGVGWGQKELSQSEAQVAARLASQEFGHPLKWLEENTTHTVALLKPEGIDHILLVTHAQHMPRALRAFKVVAPEGMTVQAAPMGLAAPMMSDPLTWLPSTAGFGKVHDALHEWLGLMAGA